MQEALDAGRGGSMKAHVTLLRAAKQRLAHTPAEYGLPYGSRLRREQFICHAISEAAISLCKELRSGVSLGRSKAVAITSARVELVRLLMERLGPNSTLEGWLVCGGWLGFRVPDDSERIKVQTTRHAWIDSLIKEFS
jgi:hypothetical protein